MGEEQTVYTDKMTLAMDAQGEIVVANAQPNPSRKLQSSIRVIGQGIDEIRDYTREIRLKPSYVAGGVEGRPPDEYMFIIMFGDEDIGFTVETSLEGGGQQ